MALVSRIDSALGLVTTNDAVASGFSVEKNPNNRGFAPFSVDAVVAITSGSTFDAAVCGVNTMSGATALTGVLPKASDVPGASLIFRNLCTNGMLLTSSQETAGSKVFVSQISGTVGNSALLRLPGTVGASVILKSDGFSFHLLSFSGSVTLT